jgi:hypothetical protein
MNGWVWWLVVKNPKDDFYSSRVILIQVDRHRSSVGKFPSLCHVTIEEAIEISRSETENDRGNEEAPLRIVKGVRYHQCCISVRNQVEWLSLKVREVAVLAIIVW